MNWKSLFACLAGTAAITLGCSSATSSSPAVPAPTPTPSVLSRINPNVVEETETYVIQRYPKEEYIRVDDRHIKHPILGTHVEFFREDDRYYYVAGSKPLSAEEAALRTQLDRQPTPRPTRRPDEGPEASAPPPSDFEDLSPSRVAGRLRLEKVTSSGLPNEGLWRASFAVADVNGDGILDIVAPPSRISPSPFLQMWTGDGKGHFSPWPLSYTETGKEKADAGIDYGAVAVGDIDGDGHADVVAAIHGGGLMSFFGNGRGTFRIERAGLPGRDYSAQAVVLLDADRDGRLDIVASRDILETLENHPLDYQQVRVYLYRGREGWQFKTDGLLRGSYSNSLHSWDFDGDGLKDVLTGSHYNGTLWLLWKNQGNGTFAPVEFPGIEIYAYHFATTPGTFGPERAPAFADAFYMFNPEPQVARAAGITLYAFRGGKWERHRVWRKKDGKTLLYGLAVGDLDGDRLDDIVFPDSEERRLKVFFQQADGTFVEAEEREEPVLDSPGQCVRLADLDRDGRLDILLSKTVSSTRAEDRGGWDVYLNRR